MNEIRISDNISYIEACEEPLSADIGIIRVGEELFLYDVGRGESNIAGLDGTYNVVLSHFHPDHTANLSAVKCKALYVSKACKREMQCQRKHYCRKQYGYREYTHIPDTFFSRKRLSRANG